jgi:hypothetical protein
MMVLLRITYKVRAHHVAEYEEIFRNRLMPLVLGYQLKFRGIWKSIIGHATEYLELWEFESVADYEIQWKKLISDPRLFSIFKTTGPMVDDEHFSIFEPMLLGEETAAPDRYSV